jgi:hypothetical protein
MVDFAGLYRRGSIYVVDQSEQEMLQRRVLVLSLTGVGECPVHRCGSRKPRGAGVVSGPSRLSPIAAERVFQSATPNA